MRVKCVKNDIGSIVFALVQNRLRRSIHLDGPMSDLAIGQQYEVQAIESDDSGIWFYLHTVGVSDYPYPYPAEFFDLVDDSLPRDWRVRFKFQEGNIEIKRIAFPEWAQDDGFYEKLVDGDIMTVAIYHKYL